MFHKLLESFLPISDASTGFLSALLCGVGSVAGGWLALAFALSEIHRVSGQDGVFGDVDVCVCGRGGGYRSSVVP